MKVTSQKKLARVGTITVERAEIRTSVEGGSVLSVVTRNVNLAVMQETDTHYGVLMSNGVTGWLPKDSVTLIDYNTEVTVPGSQESGLDGLQPRELKILECAVALLDVPFTEGGYSNKGMDAAAFVRKVYQESTGVTLPRRTRDQARVGQAVTGEQLRPGDRLYFSMKGNTVSHCGIYMGRGYFIHSSSTHGRVAVDPIYRDSHYAKRLVAIRR